MDEPANRNPTPLAGLRVCWFGSARYSHPLNETQARKWAALAQLGAELRAIGFSRDGGTRQFWQDAHFTLLPQSRFSPLRHLTLLTLGTFTLSWARWRHGCDILIAQGPYEGVVCVFIAMLGKLSGKRTVVVVENHNDFEETLFLQRSVFLAEIYRRLMRQAAQFSLKRANLFRPVSLATAAPLTKIAPDTPQIRFIAWTDTTAFLPECNERQTPEQTIIYAGVLIPRKGVHHLLEAFAKCCSKFPRANLLIIGAPTNADYTDALCKQAQMLGIADKVRFLGELTQKELGARFASARCSVLPSSSEGLGRVLIESQRTGTPVIATRVGGIPEIVRDGETGFLIPAEDSAALASALEKMLAMDVATWRTMSERARSFAKQTFSTDAFVSGYRQLLTRAKEILG